LLAVVILAVTAFVTAPIADFGRTLTFNGSFVVDPLARVLKLLAIATVALVFLYSRGYLKDRGLFKGEYYVLGLFALLGIMVMISANSLLSMYLGVEIMSLALYAMVAFDRESPVAAEAAMKYFVLGAIASGVLLYGMSVLYGLTGSIQIDVIEGTLRAGGADSLAIMLALALIIVGVAFKLGAVPFHMWVPDVYQGAPTCVTLFVGTAPKLAAFAMVIRLLVDGLGPVADEWQTLFSGLAVLSLAIGNVVAIAQTNLKRMLAYSAIAHVGFILLGFVAGDPDGYQAALFYTIIYVIMAAGAFGMIILLSRKGFEADQLDDLKGLSVRSPWFAFIMLLLMFSMVGVPPFAGFFAKWWVLAALVDAGHVGLAVVAVLFSVIGAFYYLRVIRLMYFDAPLEDEGVEADLDFRVALSANGLAVLILGLGAGGLMDICIAVLS
jgi:NADH-quinone oxidoreductase subunit N